MQLGKSCLRCATPLPDDSAGELCPACTPDARTADTSRQAAVSTPVEQFGDTVSAAQLTAAPGPFVGLATATPAAFRETQSADGVGRPGLPIIEKYEIRKELGRGGGGAVYEARQRGTERLVAVKVLSGATAGERERFRREAKALGALRHPAVVEVYDVGECDHGPFFSMELMLGGSLAARVRDGGPLSPSAAASVVEAVARGMAAVHAAGYLHRDLKPGNILLDAAGRPKIADFGLAKTWLSDPAAPTEEHITKSHALLGTPAYMAPEQADCRHADIDARTDVYGLGGVLYCALSGRAPFTGKNAAVISHRVMAEPPTPPRAVRPDVPPELEAVCLKSLEKDRADRYQTADDLADDLAAWRRGEPTVARPPSRSSLALRWLKRRRRAAVAVFLVLVFAAALNAAAMWIGKPPAPAPPDDPDAELKTILAELESGQPVILVGGTGAPRWYAKENGAIEFTASSYADDACYFEAVKNRYVELLRAADVPPAYRLRAEVRNEAAKNAYGVAGVQFGTVSAQGAGGLPRVFSHRVVFNDVTFMNMEANRFANNIRYQLGIDETLAAGQGMLPREFPQGGRAIHSPPFAAGRPWRQIDVTVGPRGVKLTGVPGEPNYQPNADFTAATLRDRWRTNHTRVLPDEAFPAAVAADPVAGGLGLYVRLGSASFRNVTIEKLSDPANRP